MDELAEHLEQVFATHTPSASEINDYVWFERDDIYEALGLDENGKVKEEDEEEEEG